VLAAPPRPGGGTAICKPDAYVRLGIGEFEDSYFIEVDRGFETPTTLARKLDEYRRYWACGLEQSWRWSLSPGVVAGAGPSAPPSRGGCLRPPASRVLEAPSSDPVRRRCRAHDRRYNVTPRNEVLGVMP